MIRKGKPRWLRRPKELKGEGAAEWKRITTRLWTLFGQDLQEIDKPAITLYCHAYLMWWFVIQQIAEGKKGPLLHQVAARLRKSVLGLLSELTDAEWANNYLKQVEDGVIEG